jgi:hypothetical protein
MMPDTIRLVARANDQSEDLASAKSFNLLAIAG